MNATIVRLAMQSLLGRRRGLVLLILPVLLLLLALVIRSLTGPGDAYPIVSTLGYGLALPLVALLSASAVLGPEIDDGSVVYLLAKLVNRYVVGLSKYLVAFLASVTFGALPLGLAGMISDVGDPSRALGWFAGGVFASAAYCAVFLAVAAFTRHAVIIGLLFVLIWESLLGGLLDGVKWISIGDWGRELAAAIGSVDSPPGTGLLYAMIAGAVITVAGLVLTGDRLRSFSLTGDE